MDSYASTLRRAVRATTIATPERILWFGLPAVQPLPAPLRRALGREQVREYVRAKLQRHLYLHFYCTGGATPWPALHRHDESATVSGYSFVERLSAANLGAGRLESGWRARVDGDSVVAERHGLAIWLQREDCVASGDPIASDAMVAVHLPKELPARLPGFYVALSDASLIDDDPGGLLRIYWNVPASGAAPLVRAITGRLNALGASFHLKVPSDPARYGRCDTGVLYLRREDFAALREPLLEVSAELSPHLRPAIPALTKPLDRGIALAEDPGRRQSFGAHRCEWIADALLRAHQRGVHAAEPRWSAFAARLTERGLDLERPYLDPDSHDVYEWRRAPASVTGAPPRSIGAPRPPSTGELRIVAAQIANTLCAQAIWDGDRCTWIGATADRAHGECLATLGFDLYSGTAGVALFLGEFAALTGDHGARCTAIGAMRQSLANAGDSAASARLGLYTGWTGVAYAAARLAFILAEPELGRAARTLVRRALARRTRPAQFDLLGGSAGAITGLLAFRSLLRDDASLAYAVRLGEQLLRAAIKRDGDWAWKMDRRATDSPLTGYSHGAAGIADALLLLYDATGDERFRGAAERGFAYERRLYNDAEENWPDLRGRAASPRLAPAYPCSAFWCHGAPGIALSRLRATRLLGDGPWHEEARRALLTTHRATSTALASGGVGYSLCHGLAGNAEILALGDAMLDDSEARGREMALAVAASGIVRFADAGDWPLDLSGPMFGLLTGLAGVGHFYLRLAAPRTPSILFLDPAAVARTPHAHAARPPASLDGLMAKVERGLRDAVRCGEPGIEEICAHYLGAGGKRLRPTLVLLAAQCGGRVSAEAVRFAIAIELLHTATLYHDDIVDRAAIRRGQPSANARWGNSVSALAGGFLFARAMRAFADAGARVDRAAGDAVHRTWEGQAEEARSSASLAIGEDEYRRIIALKTGTLYELSAELGAIAGHLPDRHAATLRRFGATFGLGFQLLDDVLDLAGESALLGKSAAADLRGGIYTLAVIRMLRRDDADAARLRDLLARRSMSDADVDAARGLLRASGAIADALREATATLERARAPLGDLPSGAAVDALDQLIGSTLRRADALLT